MGIRIRGVSDEKVQELLDELALLSKTAGGDVVEVVIQERKKYSPGTLIGKGKAYGIRDICQEKDIQTVIFDDELSPSQQQNLEKIIGVKVLDRSILILDIFAKKARTFEGKLQVELAQLNYMLPRLKGRGVEMSRLGGGIGTRGPGETKLEVDKRRTQQKITKIRHELDLVRKRRKVQRAKRQSIPIPVVALVGYTNAGKSTILNKLCHSSTLVEDKLFSTLDPTTRRIRLPNGQVVLISDTVGFIQKLPHQLIAAFKATLEEVSEANVLIHVINGSHKERLIQQKTVEDLLREMKIVDKPVINVINKSDLVENKLYLTCLAKELDASVVSAINNQGLESILKRIQEKTKSTLSHIELDVPYQAFNNIISIIRKYGNVVKQEFLDNSVEVEAYVETKAMAKINRLIKYI